MQQIAVVNSFLFLLGPASTSTSTGGSGSSSSSGLQGIGSPEGVVTAEPGQTYWDSTGDIFWVKDTGSGNTGWYQLVG
jgi:hypothetical protein